MKIPVRTDVSNRIQQLLCEALDLDPHKISQYGFTVESSNGAYVEVTWEGRALLHINQWQSIVSSAQRGPSGE